MTTTQVTIVYRMAVALMLLTPAVAAAQTPPAGGLQTLSMEQLLAVPIATPSRLPQTRLRAPASAFVITQDDIRTSGAITLAELLRTVPGLHVAQIDGNKWAIGSRGFTDRLARAMLVMIDGRAVYSPLFAGTYWEAQDVPLQDIERIEVIRGPGGALWGANAVTGIINIIRKSAAQSDGFSLTAGSGSGEPGLLEAAIGMGDERRQFRISGKALGRAAQNAPLDHGYDDARFVSGGARLDWRSDSSAGTVEAEAYRVTFGQRDALSTLSPPSVTNVVTTDRQSGGHLLLRWQPDPDDARGLQVQSYLDYTTRTELQYDEQQTVFDLDVQEGLVRGRHGLLWGGGYRLTRSDTSTRGLLRFTRNRRTDHLFSGFVADEIRLRDTVDLTLGTKVEHNAYSGVEWQPSARVLWTPSPTHSVSASVTRAVRTPSPVEHQFESGSLLSAAGPTFVRLSPNPDFQAEVLTAWEVGFVGRPHRSLLWTVAFFHNEHDRAMSLELSPTFVETDDAGRRTVVPVAFGNGLQGDSGGVEVTADIRPTAWWRSTINYSFLNVSLHKRPGSRDAGNEARAEGISPHHQLQASSTIRMGSRWTTSWFLRAIGEVRAINIPSYVTSDVKVEWRATPELSLYATGRNLHQRHHVEFADSGNGMINIERSIFVGLRWQR